MEKDNLRKKAASMSTAEVTTVAEEKHLSENPTKKPKGKSKGRVRQIPLRRPFNRSMGKSYLN